VPARRPTTHSKFMSASLRKPATRSCQSHPASSFCDGLQTARTRVETEPERELARTRLKHCRAGHYLRPFRSAALTIAVTGARNLGRAPAPVRYDLDQGESSQTIGAWSAAVPVYRVALEHLLFHARYKDRELADKLRLVSAVSAPHMDPTGCVLWMSRT
jgi:hypothetical protein